MLFTGKKIGVGISIEETRGVKKIPIQYWFPRTDHTFFDRATLGQGNGTIGTNTPLG